MEMKDSITAKLSQATCDKIEWNRKVLILRRGFVEANKALGEKTGKKGKNK